MGGLNALNKELNMSLPNIDLELLETPEFEQVQAKALAHAPRILLLYGSTVSALSAVWRCWKPGVFCSSLAQR
jgi:hypothetical protein